MTDNTTAAAPSAQQAAGSIDEPTKPAVRFMWTSLFTNKCTGIQFSLGTAARADIDVMAEELLESPEIDTDKVYEVAVMKRADYDAITALAATATPAQPIGIVATYNRGGSGEHNGIEPIGKAHHSLAESLPAGTLLYAAPVAQPIAPTDDCLHDDTVRQGAIWTACKQCGRCWADAEVATVEQPIAVSAPKLPDGWVTLSITWDEGYPEEVAFGPQHLMDRLKKKLDKYYAGVIAARNSPAAAVSAPTDDIPKAIMALRCVNPYPEDNCNLYKEGYAVARQEAAEIAARAAFEASRTRGHDYDKNEFGSYRNALVESDFLTWKAARAAAPVSGPTDDMSPILAWLEKAAQSDICDISYSARTMMAHFQSAEPSAAPVGGQGASDLSLADFTKMEQHGVVALIREKNATIKAHQSVLADRDNEIFALRAALDSRPRSEDSQKEAFRQALEIIAVGDTTSPKACAEEVLIATGFWNAALASTTPQKADK